MGIVGRRRAAEGGRRVGCRRACCRRVCCRRVAGGRVAGCSMLAVAAADDPAVMVEYSTRRQYISPASPARRRTCGL